ncbi:MAG: hypothetical protein EBS53_09375 [Bacteroidetes bacterium]|nr:hypothetical protein [Bacteroidota bacterium]
MTDKIYKLLKKRLNEIHTKAIGDPYEWPVERLWCDYLDEIGCRRFHSSAILDILDQITPGIEDHVVCVNPMSGFMNYIAVPKETALKAIVLGDFPEFSL